MIRSIQGMSDLKIFLDPRVLSQLHPVIRSDACSTDISLPARILPQICPAPFCVSGYDGHVDRFSVYKKTAFIDWMKYVSAQGISYSLNF